ncbi:MAG: hypothetical protein MPI93_06135 [Nitrosopumilus sp.]|nr:hypothetical protein [Nitrosopumilus sp.]
METQTAEEKEVYRIAMEIQMTAEEKEAYRIAMKYRKEYEDLLVLLKQLPAAARSKEEMRKDLFGEGFEELQKEIKRVMEERCHQ